jgi:hypothetical protein
MSLADDIEIISDRAAIPKDRKRRPTTRWDHLAKQQSFSMPKVPSRRRLGETIEEDTATEIYPLPKRTITQSSLSYPPRGGAVRRNSGDGEKGAARPGMVRQASMSCLPRHTKSINSLSEVEQMKMPRLVKQKSLHRKRCNNDQSTDSKPCMMHKQNASSLPNRPSRSHRRCLSNEGLEPNPLPKLPVRTDDSDESTDTLSSMPRLVKQTSFTVARLSSRGPLIGNDEKVGNRTDRRERMAKQNSFTMPRRPTRTFDSDDELDERTDTLSSMPRLVKQTSFTVARHSSRGPLIGDDDEEENGCDRRQRMAKQNSFTMPRHPTRTFDSEDDLDESKDTLSSMPRLVKQTSFTVARNSSLRPLIGDDEKEGNSIKPNSVSSPKRPTRTFDSEDESAEKTDTLSSMPRLVEQTSFTIPILSSVTLQDESDAPHNSGNNDESKSTSDLSPQELSTSDVDVDVVISKKLGSASISLESEKRKHLRLLGQAKTVDCNTESSEWTHHQREHLFTA